MLIFQQPYDIDQYYKFETRHDASDSDEVKNKSCFLVFVWDFLHVSGYSCGRILRFFTTCQKMFSACFADTIWSIFNNCFKEFFSNLYSSLSDYLSLFVILFFFIILELVVSWSEKRPQNIIITTIKVYWFS